MADDDTASQRLALALDMFEFGVEMMAATLRRRYPGATAEELERRLDAWLTERPGAEHGDAEGIPVSLARFASSRSAASVAVAISLLRSPNGGHSRCPENETARCREASRRE